MVLLHYSVEHLKNDLLQIVTKHCGQKKFSLFFFGSRVAKKNVDDRADVDVGFSGDEKLNLSALRKIKEEIDAIKTLYKIDFVDFSRTTDAFREEALQHVEYIRS